MDTIKRIDEIQKLLQNDDLSMDVKLELKQELQELQGKTTRPPDSNFECVGCGS